MSLENLKTLDVIETMEAFLERKRPPEEIRPKLDIGYKIEGQSIYIFEIRPRWTNPEIKDEYSLAKATFLLSRNQWKVYWMLANGKWCPFEPQPVVKDLKEFVKLVEEDAYHCFWG